MFADSHDPRGKLYAGSVSCRSCHQSIYDSVLRSGHYNASAPATDQTVLGNFNEGHNKFVYEMGMSVRMEKRDSGLYQVMYVDGKEKLARRFDITFGVKNGQTCLYWANNNTYQLPISYYTSVADWGTSPGFSIMFPEFNRLVGKNCFECHSSYVKGIDQVHMKDSNVAEEREASEKMDKNSLVFGIDCERCHGPAAGHVNFQQDNPTVKTAKYITANNSLNAQQNRDQCALCHSGNDQEKLKSRFEFKPGDTLSAFFKPRTDNSTFDLHGNQYGLLAQSKCFIKSNAMNCTTCHSPHGNAVKNPVVYSQKCMGCHTEANHNFCTSTAATGTSLKDNCIKCHMPEGPSQVIQFRLSGDSLNYAQLFRTHRIGIYLENKKTN